MWSVVVKPFVQVTVTSNSVWLRSTSSGAPTTALVMMRSPASRSLLNAASTMSAESVVTSTLNPVVLVHPAGDVCSDIEQTVPGGSSGVAGVAHVPSCPLVVIDCAPTNTTAPSGAVHATSNTNVSSRSIGCVSGPVVVLVIESVLVELMISIASPSRSTTTSAPIVVAKRASGVSTTEHAAFVGRAAIVNGALTEICPAST